LKELIQDFDKEFILKKNKENIFSICHDGEKLKIVAIGAAPSPIIEDNYHPEVARDINYVISSFNKKVPPGRICILSGEPGTGKTHLIRGLVSKIDALFIIVPSNLLGELDSPNLLPLLLDTKNMYELPIILILEDGDACLVPRKSDNISLIASLLNLSDGILGAIMDIRIVVSTNAQIKEVDQAITRPGRLCKQIHVGPLPWEQANKVYKRLVDNQEAKMPTKTIRHYTLAEVYQMANNEPEATLTLSSVNKKVIGFNTSHNQPDLTVNKLT
jgi:hypothetical protein